MSYCLVRSEHIYADYTMPMAKLIWQRTFSSFAPVGIVFLMLFLNRVDQRLICTPLSVRIGSHNFAPAIFHRCRGNIKHVFWIPGRVGRE